MWCLLTTPPPFPRASNADEELETRAFDYLRRSRRLALAERVPEPASENLVASFERAVF